MDEECLAQLLHRIERAERELRANAQLLTRLMEEGHDTELAQRALQAYIQIVLILHQQHDALVERLRQRPVLVV